MLNTNTNLPLYLNGSIETKNFAIYNQESNTEIFTNVQFFEGSVRDDLKVMEHPKEDGTSIADHVIDDAKSGTVRLIVSDDDSSSLNEILECYKNRTLLVIKIKNEIFSNFIISSKPLKADPQYYDNTVYELSFKEVLEAQTQYVKMSVPQVKSPKNASTVKTGQKQPQKTEAKPSVLRGLLDKVRK